MADVADIVLLTAARATTFRPDALSARPPQLVVPDLLYIAVATSRDADVAQCFPAVGEVPVVCLSASVPGGDAHNQNLESWYAGRLRRTA
jgi:hypothetical protein